MAGQSADSRRSFIQAHARLGRPPLTPELSLWLADEATALWEASEDFLDVHGLPPPFWAFAWAGGQALARYVLDNPMTVAGKRVLDFGAGGGIAAIAALKAGAESALASDLDPFAADAARLNGDANGVSPDAHVGDATALAPTAFDVILAADVCYDRNQATPATEWLSAAARSAVVLIGDPGRSYLPADRLTAIADYDVPTPLALEMAPITPTRIWRITGAANSD